MGENKVFENIGEEENEKIKAMLRDGDVKEDNSDSEEQSGNDTKNGAEKEQSGASEQLNEHSFGKFKNPQELLRAYGELEREFTRRSQRLKELESAMGQTVKSDVDWKGTVDKFFKEIPAAKAFARDIANVIVENPELKDDPSCLNVALMRVLTDKFRTPEQLMQDGQFLNDYVLGSERVREAIIADYLDGVRGDMPPRTMLSGGMQCVAPKVKPRTIEEAGIMFLKNNK